MAYGIEIARALSAAHAQRLVHRDVKPQNVLIDLEGRAKVTDFGIARSMEAHGLTATGRVLGTTDYVSPEQALGHQVDEQSDLYSLGIVLYEMLTGEVPFQADTQVAVAMKHVQEAMPDVQRRRPQVSSALAKVLEGATAKETANRYATADEMVHDLEEVLAIEAARAGETSGEATTVLQGLKGDTADFAPGRLRRGRWRVVLTTALVVGLVGGLVALFVTRAEKGPGDAVTPPAPGLERVDLAAGAVEDFDPEGDGDGPRPGRSTPSTATAPRLERRDLPRRPDRRRKEGVGLYVNAGSPIAAGHFVVVTSTPDLRPKSTERRPPAAADVGR